MSEFGLHHEGFRNGDQSLAEVRSAERLFTLENLYGMATNRYKRFLSRNLDRFDKLEELEDHEAFSLGIQDTSFIRGIGLTGVSEVDIVCVHTKGLLDGEVKLADHETSILVVGNIDGQDKILSSAPLKRFLDDDPHFDLMDGPQSYDHLQQAQQSLLDMAGEQAYLITQVTRFLKGQ